MSNGIRRNSIARPVAGLALALALLGAAAQAQQQAGNLYGTAQDGQHAALPGVTVTLSGGGAPQVQVSNAQGQFRFLGLSPGSYALKAELEGFSTVSYPNVVINVGRNTQIELSLSAAIEDVITVTAESPLLDERRISTGATVSSTELEKIPTARDPWAILQSTPGVLTDRINVGGNESGQQSLFVGPGASCVQTVWAVDGVVITDMAALGASPAYYDFDAFEEMQITTGGSDTSLATPGVALNMVTKRGTNEWRGSGRFYSTKADGPGPLDQSDLQFSNGELGQAGPWNSISRVRNFVAGTVTDPGGAHSQTAFKQGNRIVDVKDYGAEVGGPVVKDRLWVWGSYGRNKIDLLTIADVSDFTDLKSKNAKLNAQIAANNSATAFYFDSDKTKIGRNAGPTRPQETTWDQGHFGPKPTTYKVEDTHIFSSSFYLSGMYSKVNGGFELVPEGGATPTAYIDESSVWHNTFLLAQTERPQKQYKADASDFFNTGSLSHELKFGAGYRDAEVTSLSRWGGYGILLNGPQFFGTSDNVLAVARDANPKVKQKYTTAYVQDTMTVGNLTANVGIRYDRQGGDNEPITVRANPLLPSVLPAASFRGGDIGFEWSDITPRLGLTYALGAERKTLLRASYSRFADQLGTGVASQLNPAVLNQYAYFYSTNPGNGAVTPGQIGDLFGYSGNVDPNTGLLLQSNAVDSGLSAPLTDEVLLSVEHALLPEFVIGLNLTYRKLSNLLENELLVFDSDPYSAANLGSVGRRHSRNDYVPGYATPFNGIAAGGTTRSIVVCNAGATPQQCFSSSTFRHTEVIPLQTPDGKPYALNFYQLKPGVFTRNGTFLRNGDREQEYKGASLVFNKRLANHWMLRGNFTFSDWTWSKVPASEVENPTLTLGGGNREGDQVLQGSGTGSGSKGGVYINSKWAYSVNGLYQVMPDRPWGFNVAANLTGRQGYPIPYFQRVTLDSNQQNVSTNVQVTGRPDSYRLDDVRVLDMRLEKELSFSDFGATVGLDVFNVTNESYVLQRNHRLAQATSDHVREITSPRIYRLGLRLSFR